MIESSDALPTPKGLGGGPGEQEEEEANSFTTSMRSPEFTTSSSRARALLGRLENLFDDEEEES